MKRIIWSSFLVVMLSGIMQPTLSEAQIVNPAIPRTWWNSVKNYIDQKAENIIWNVQSSFTNKIFESDGTEGDTLAVFTPQAALQIQNVSVWLSANNTPDSTLYLVMQHGSSDTLVTIDSTGNGIETYFESTSSFNYAASEVCSLLFLSGADSVSVGRAFITLQVKNR